MREGKPGIVTLTTDFGLQDHYVAAMKGVMLRINPQLTLVDISHDIHPFSITEAAITLEAAYTYFPPGTIHLVVVDPGVGSRRRPLVVAARDYVFVAPDNGVLSLVFRREPEIRVYEIKASEYFLGTPSSTFHGRDIFAPVAARISLGVEPERLGPRLEDFVRFNLPEPEFTTNGLQGEIIHIDKFGNLISNITLGDFQRAGRPAEDGRFAVQVGDYTVRRLIDHYAQGREGEVCALFGSSGRLELTVNQQRADEVLGCGRGQKMVVYFY